MAKSNIEWTENTWNFLTGCTKISAGCQNCYAEKFAKRLQSMRLPKYTNGFTLSIHENDLELPLTWKKPRKIFVNSMSDLFHENVPLEIIQKSFSVMNRASWHQFQILTKRSQRLADLNNQLSWSDNIWMGVSIENADCLFRINHLKKTNAAIKFLSLEPLLERLPDIDLSGIDWVIVGGESGFNSRGIIEEWVVEIQQRCKIWGVPFFFKQWGGLNKKKAGRILQGRIWEQFPEFPRENKQQFALMT